MNPLEIWKERSNEKPSRSPCFFFDLLNKPLSSGLNPAQLDFNIALGSVVYITIRPGTIKLAPILTLRTRIEWFVKKFMFFIRVLYPKGIVLKALTSTLGEENRFPPSKMVEVEHCVTEILS